MTNLQPYKFYGDEADFWLIDKNNEAVVKYDLINDTIFSTHGVRGQAPFENQRLKNFDFDESGYYLIDNSKEMLKKMSYSDSLIYYYKLDFHMTDGVHLKNNNFLVIVMDLNGDYSFMKINAIDKNVEITKFVDVIDLKDEDIDMSLIYDGYFIKNKQGESVYLCYRTGLFIHFDSRGEFTYVTNTLDKIPPPKKVLRDLGEGVIMHDVEPDQIINYSASCDNDNLYILSNVVEPEYKGKRVIDVYLLSDGSYSKSIMLENFEEQRPDEIYKAENYFYVLYEDGAVARLN